MAEGLSAPPSSHAEGPDTPAETMLLRGEDLLSRRLLRDAVAVLDRAEAAGAEANRCAGGRWQCWMLLGEMEQAWRESDAIRRRGAPDASHLWDGSDPAGRSVMVRSLHGFGDAVQNLRFLPALRKRARHVTLEVAPELFELAGFTQGADEVITWGDAAPSHTPAYDMQVEITELPYLLRVAAPALAEGPAYLALPATRIAAFRRSLPPGREPNVGIAWNSSQWDVSRSIPLPRLEPLLRLEGVRFWSLQTMADNGAWRQMWNSWERPAWMAAEGSTLQTAVALLHMDLVITVDTFVAHLAGALGRPVWLLLKFDADWRWGVGRAASPWYPTMRLFRQPSPGAWQPVLAEVERCLRDWVSNQKESCATLGQL